MKTVLLVEDDAQIRSAYSFVLAQKYRVIAVEDGEAALAVLRKEAPDVMLLDMLMPGLSGLDLLRNTKLKELYPGMIIIGFSNVDNPKIVSEAVTLGVDKYLLKVDTTPSSVSDTISQMLTTKAAE